MPSATANRLVSRSATSASNPASSTMAPSSSSTSVSTNNSSQTSIPRSQSRQCPSPPSEKAKSVLQSTLSRTYLPVFSMLRRYWRKFNETDSLGKRSIARALAAFKMGLYFKIFISLIIFVRLVSHSSQRAFPVDAKYRDDHFRTLAAAPISSDVRIIVITQSGYTDRLHRLLKSFADADYERESAALDVWMFASSTCNYLPLPVYPLAVAVFGPPRFDHSIPRIVQSIDWRHGPKQLIAVRSEPDWVGSWESNQGTMNETLIFVDATVTQSVSPAFYTWLKQVRAAIRRGRITNAPVLSLDAVTVPEDVPSSDTAILLDQFFPATSVFSPTQDAWITFQKWYTLRTRSWFARPSLPRDLMLGGYSALDWMRMHPVRAWFAQFLSLYGERVVYPILPEKHVLVTRASASTVGVMSGTGLHSGVHLEKRGEIDNNQFKGALKDIAVPERPVVIKANGSVTNADAPVGSTMGKRPGRETRVVVEDVLETNAASKYRGALRHIGEFARSRGSDVVSLTVVTAAFLNTTASWLCNVAILDFTPPAVVLIASDDAVASSLRTFLEMHPRLAQGSLVVSMRGAIASTRLNADAPLDFGRSEYWRLMLLRSLLFRDILDSGLALFNFETDQIWLSDPMPYIRHELRPCLANEGVIEDYRIPDAVVTINTLEDVAGNFFYLRPTVGARHMMTKIADRFFLSYRSSRRSLAARFDRYHYIANDQSIMTTLITNRDWVYARRFPKVKVAILNRDLFVDGQWFADFEDKYGNRVSKRKYYTSESSLYPVIVNNNFIIGIEQKTKRAQRFGFWFITWTNASTLTPECDSLAVRRAARSGSIKEQRDAPVIELGRPNAAI